MKMTASFLKLVCLRAELVVAGSTYGKHSGTINDAVDSSEN